MKAQDYQSKDNNRADIVDRLIAVCDSLGLSYSYTEATFSITLPTVEPVPVTPVANNTTKRKTFDIANWGEKSVDEALPDDFQMPDTGQQLDEGTPPKEDREP